MSNSVEIKNDTSINPDTEPVKSSALVIDANGGAASISEEVGRTWFNIAADTKAPAILIIGTANGTIPSFLNPFITEATVDRPVFIASTNYAYDEGPLVKDTPYDSQIETASAGAVLLRDVNINGLGDILDTINQGAETGLVGRELRDFVLERFGTPEPLAHFTE